MAANSVIMLVYVLGLWCICDGHECAGDREITVQEGDPFSLTCTADNLNTTFVKWYLTRTGQSRKRLGYCTIADDANCLVTKASIYELVMNASSSISKLSVKRALTPRNIAGTVECQIFRRQGSEQVPASNGTCRITIEYPADKVYNCKLLWNPKDWSVFGSCDVKKLFRRDPEYHCAWRHVSKAAETWQKVTIGVPLGRRKVRCGLQGFHINASDSDWLLSLWINKGADWMFAKNVPFVRPGDPQLSADCPQTIAEGSNLACSCQPSSSSPGTPRPLVTWVPRKARPLLRISNVSRSSDGDLHTCYQYWGGWRDPATIQYRLNVLSPRTPESPEATNQTASNTTSTSDDNEGGGRRVAIIVGGVVSVVVIAVAAVIVVVVVVVVVWRRRKRDTKANPQTPDDGYVCAEMEVYENNYLAYLQEQTTTQTDNNSTVEQEQRRHQVMTDRGHQEIQDASSIYTLPKKQRGKRAARDQQVFHQPDGNKAEEELQISSDELYGNADELYGNTDELYGNADELYGNTDEFYGNTQENWSDDVYEIQ
ncbi:uncharacterized protein LOC143291674 [Babylonia areolata]|uniref:uncharacterized protein LOC143291674 n=1 Tax=Babylonia areolata TaxID=304850 RepID=UPI003FD5CA87